MQARYRIGRTVVLMGGWLLASPIIAAEPAAAETPPTRPAPARLDLPESAPAAAAVPTPPPPAGPAPAPPAVSAPAAIPVPAKESASQGPVALRYKFDVNQVVYYDVLHTMRITSQKNQSSETAENESHSVKHYRVISVEDNGSAVLELTIDRVRMTARFGENDPVTFNSDSTDSPPPQFERVRESVGKPLARVKVAASGELLNVVRAGAPANAGADSPDNDPGNNFLIPLPKTPVKVGDSWTDQIEVKVTISKGLTKNIAILRRYDLKAINGSQAVIEMNSTVATPIRDPKLNGQLIQRTPAGTILFDIENGQIVSRELKTDKTEIGVFDDNSSMRAVSSRIEKRLGRDEALRTAIEEKKTPPTGGKSLN